MSDSGCAALWVDHALPSALIVERIVDFTRLCGDAGSYSYQDISAALLELVKRSVVGCLSQSPRVIDIDGSLERGEKAVASRICA